MRIGVIGAGVIGQLRAQSVTKNPAATLVAVVDPVSASAERAVAGTGAVALTSTSELLSRDDLDAVIVSSPLPNHEEAVLGAYQRGLHVLCEKPLGSSVESAARMLAAARSADRVLAVGFNHRYYPAIQFIKETITSGRIGALDHVRVFGGHDGLANFKADWQYRAPASGGGAMMDVGIHMTDLVRYLVGDIQDVCGVVSNKIWKVPGSEDNAMAIFKTAAGLPVFYQACWTEWRGYGFYVDVYGETGMVRGYYAPMFNLLVTSDRPGGRRKRKMRFYPEIIVREKLKTWTSTALLSFEAELRDFQRMAAGERGLTLADGEAGVRSVEVAQAVYESSRVGGPVRLAPRPESPA
jgi:predicted dehydrogenase